MFQFTTKLGAVNHKWVEKCDKMNLDSVPHFNGSIDRGVVRGVVTGHANMMLHIIIGLDV